MSAQIAGGPFTDGNKRTGFLVASYYLTQVGSPVPDPVSVDQAENLCLRVSSGQLRDVDLIAAELRQLWSGSGGGRRP